MKKIMLLLLIVSFASCKRKVEVKYTYFANDKKSSEWTEVNGIKQGQLRTFYEKEKFSHLLILWME